MEFFLISLFAVLPTMIPLGILSIKLISQFQYLHQFNKRDIGILIMGIIFMFPSFWYLSVYLEVYFFNRDDNGLLLMFAFIPVVITSLFADICILGAFSRYSQNMQNGQNNHSKLACFFGYCAGIALLLFVRLIFAHIACWGLLYFPISFSDWEGRILWFFWGVGFFLVSVIFLIFHKGKNQIIVNEKGFHIGVSLVFLSIIAYVFLGLHGGLDGGISNSVWFYTVLVAVIDSFAILLIKNNLQNSKNSIKSQV